MPNVFRAGRVWVCDLAGPLTTDLVVLKSIRWVNATTPGHTVTLADAAGNVIYGDAASVVAYTAESFGVEGLQLSGLSVAQISSGLLFIYLYHDR